MTEICPQCHKRINEWQIKNGKTEFFAGVRIHKDCIPEVKPYDHDDAEAMEEK